MNSNENVGAARLVYDQRFFGQAAVRILLSDTAAEIQQLPTVTQGTQPVALFGRSANSPSTTRRSAHLGDCRALRSAITTRRAMLDRPWPAAQLHGSVYKGNHDEPVLGGFIKIEIQRQGTTPTNGVWQDVTGEVLGARDRGQEPRGLDRATIANRWNKIPDNAGGVRRRVRLSRTRMRLSACSACETSPSTCGACGVTVAAAACVTAVSENEHDYWPNTLYDAREAQTRDATAAASTDIALAGVMHYVELDVNNLRRWLAGQFAGDWRPERRQCQERQRLHRVFLRPARQQEPGRRSGRDRRIRLRRHGQSRQPRRARPMAGCQTPAKTRTATACSISMAGLRATCQPFRLLTPTGTPCVAGYPNPLHAATLVTQVLTDASVGVGLPQWATVPVCGVSVPATSRPSSRRSSRAPIGRCFSVAR